MIKRQSQISLKIRIQTQVNEDEDIIDVIIVIFGPEDYDQSVRSDIS